MLRGQGRNNLSPEDIQSGLDALHVISLQSVKCSESLDLRDQLHAPAAKCHDETHLYSRICTQQHLLQCDSHSNDVTQTPSIITPNRQR